MKYKPLLILFAAALTASGYAQSRIYRCGNTYTNDTAEAQAKGCKVIEGGNVTVVQGTRVNRSSAAVRVATAPQVATSRARIDSDEQRARDSDARRILEAELKKAETRQAALLKEYNNGEPEKLGPEHRNNQKYLDRISELKVNLARVESDIAGLKRELSRIASR